MESTTERYIWLLREDYCLKDHSKEGGEGLALSEDYHKGEILRAFCSFENAYKAMRERIKVYATGKSELFDGKGGIIGLIELMEDCWEDVAYTKQETLELLRAFCMGEEVSVKKGWRFDSDRAPEFWQGENWKPLRLDRVRKIYHPYIYINAFRNMEGEKYYFFHVGRGCPEDVGEDIYLSLAKTEVEQKNEPVPEHRGRYRIRAFSSPERS